MTADPILDDLFHGVIWAAFIAESRAVGGWPDPEKTRQRAYRLYEEEMAARHGGSSQQPLAVPADPAHPPRELSKEHAS